MLSLELERRQWEQEALSENPLSIESIFKMSAILKMSAWINPMVCTALWHCQSTQACYENTIPPPSFSV